ncbi:MAG: PH domain-containing protein [Candidatus Aenigmarchaeota archaeon]|nr:PH domain-containing protein [Candidatus Aenigmarchaeota archaeon]
MTKEQIIWKGTPSQIVNIDIFLSSLLLFIPPFILLSAFPNVTYIKFLYIIPIYLIIKTWLDIKCTTYEFTTERIFTTKGILSRTKEELKLYRIKDETIEQPFFIRLFSLENLIIYTSDITNNKFKFKAIPQSKELRNKISKYSEKQRDKKGVTEIDIGSIKGSVDK